VLSGRGLCDELITRPGESYRLCCVVVCDLETSTIGAPYIYIYIYKISCLRVKDFEIITSRNLLAQTIQTVLPLASVFLKLNALNSSLISLFLRLKALLYTTDFQSNFSGRDTLLSE